MLLDLGNTGACEERRFHIAVAYDAALMPQRAMAVGAFVSTNSVL